VYVRLFDLRSKERPVHLSYDMSVAKQKQNKSEQLKAGSVDLELTIDPAHPGEIFGTMIFLYLMVCSIQKKNDCKIMLGL